MVFKTAPRKRSHLHNFRNSSAKYSYLENGEAVHLA